MSYTNYIETIRRLNVRTITPEEECILSTISWADIDKYNVRGSLGSRIDEAIGLLISASNLATTRASCEGVTRSLDGATTSIINAYIKRLYDNFPDKVHGSVTPNPTLEGILEVMSLESTLACAIGVLTENPMLIIYAIDAYVFNLGTGRSGTGVMGINLIRVKDYIKTHALGNCPDVVIDALCFEKEHPFYTDGNTNYCYDSNKYGDLLAAVESGDPIDTEKLFPALINGLSDLNSMLFKFEKPLVSKGQNMFTLTDNQMNIIDAVLKPSNLPSASELIALANECAGKKEEVKVLEQKVSELTAQVATLSTKQSASFEVPASDGNIPSGKSKEYKVETLFPVLKKANVSFPITGYEWGGKHPHVPEINPNYVFKIESLLPILMGLANGENIWLSGHTGTGKTTLIEQICARLNYPLVRVAFDHAIDRYELMGTTTLISDGKGGTKSRFNPGIMEQTLPNGYVLLCDELDCARPDSLYVMQDVLEHKTKFVLESNDDTGTKAREIHFHPMSRIIATGNTKGNGDQFNLYPACRTLSAATLDRFTTWVEVEYLSPKEEKELLKKSGLVGAMTAKQIDSITEFARCMRDSFINGRIPVSFSPRRELQFAKKTNFLMGIAKYDFAKATRVALQAVVVASADKDSVDSILSLAQVAFGIDNTKAYKNIF